MSSTQAAIQDMKRARPGNVPAWACLPAEKTLAGNGCAQQQQQRCSNFDEFYDISDLSEIAASPDFYQTSTEGESLSAQQVDEPQQSESPKRSDKPRTRSRSANQVRHACQNLFQGASSIVRRSSHSAVPREKQMSLQPEINRASPRISGKSVSQVNHTACGSDQGEDTRTSAAFLPEISVSSP